MDMRDIRTRNATDLGPSYGVIAMDATDVADLLPVILPDFDETITWGPCRWQSRDATSLPAMGDSCLVVFDNQQNPWIVAWWPF